MVFRDESSAAVLICREPEDDVEQRLENEIHDYIKNFLKHALGRDEIGEFAGATEKNQDFTLWEKWEAEQQLERAENKYKRARHNYKFFSG